MHVIDANFRDIDETTVGELFGAIGTYVLWAPQASRRPSYIGEGQILRRFADEHIARFGAGARGRVTVMSEGSETRRKIDGEIVEAALFLLGEELELEPTHNRAPGKWKGHNQVRINCSGVHPLRIRSRISGTQRLILHMYEDERNFVVELQRRVAPLMITRRAAHVETNGHGLGTVHPAEQAPMHSTSLSRPAFFSYAA